MAYRLLDHTADLGIEVSAATLGELFSECLRGLTDCLTRLETVHGRTTRTVRVEAPDLDQLLVDFLGEAIFLYEADGLVFVDAGVSIRPDDRGWRLDAELVGEPHDVARHGLKTLIKAVTYHQLRVEKRRGRWTVRVIFDI